MKTIFISLVDAKFVGAFGWLSALLVAITVIAVM